MRAVVVSRPGGPEVLRVVDIRSNLLRASTVLDQAALDKYSFTRDAHLQRRRADIYENKVSDDDGQEPQGDGQIPPLPESQPEPQPQK